MLGSQTAYEHFKAWADDHPDEINMPSHDALPPVPPFVPERAGETEAAQVVAELGRRAAIHRFGQERKAELLEKACTSLPHNIAFNLVRAGMQRGFSAASEWMLRDGCQSDLPRWGEVRGHVSLGFSFAILEDISQAIVSIDATETAHVILALSAEVGWESCRAATDKALEIVA